VGLSLRDRLAEIALHGARESLPDALGCAAGPDERSVGAPHLDRDDVRLAAELRLDLQGQVRRDVDLLPAHELRAQDAVDVLGEAGAGIVERLPAQRGGQEPAEDDRADKQDSGAGEGEDVQPLTER
jgi:hypothetical protein